MDTFLHIAIDGPVGAGKSDISHRLAQELHITYLYTGAMYRALAYRCLELGVSLEDEEAVVKTLESTTIQLEKSEKGSSYPVSVLLNGQVVTEKLFTHEIDEATPIVSKIGAVRKIMVERQKQMAQSASVVMEGRDIGLRVLPGAQLKIYLTANIEERAKRRWQQSHEKGSTKTLEEVIEDTEKRDKMDSEREVDPLMKLPDSWELDTSGLSQDEVVDKIKQELVKRNLL